MAGTPRSEGPPRAPPRLSQAKAAREQAESRLGDREEQLLATQQELGRLRQGSGASPDGDALYKVP